MPPVPPLEGLHVDDVEQGDLVLVKYSTFPVWPATVAPCNQPKWKGKVKKGSKGKEVVWVQFFCENSGAWIVPARMDRFHPSLTKKFMIRESDKYFDKQKEAMTVATEDYAFLHREGNSASPKGSSAQEGQEVGAEAEAEAEAEAGSEGEAGAEAEGDGPAGETDAADHDEEQSEDAIETPDRDAEEAAKKKRRTSSGRQLKPRTKPAAEASAKGPDKPAKAAKKRGRPAKSDGKKGGRLGTSAPVTKRARRQAVSEVASDDESANEDPPQEGGVDEEYVLGPVGSDVEMDQPSAKQRKKSARTPAAAQDVKLRSLQKSKRKLDKDVARMAEDIAAKDIRIVELERKITKLSNRLKSVAVKIVLPETETALPVDLPPPEERAQKPMEEKALVSLVRECKASFASYEASVMAFLEKDKELESAASDAKRKVQDLFEEYKDTTEAMLAKEKDVAGLLRSVYHAKITPNAIVSSEVVKVVSRVARRSSDNSYLLAGLAEAVTKSIREFCEEEDKKDEREMSAGPESEGSRGKTDGEFAKEHSEEGNTEGHKEVDGTVAGVEKEDEQAKAAETGLAEVEEQDEGAKSNDESPPTPAPESEEGDGDEGGIDVGKTEGNEELAT